MASIRNAIVKVAQDLGYSGSVPRSIAGAVTALGTVLGGGGFELLPATADALGGVKVGSGLAVTSDGTLSASGGRFVCNATVDAETGVTTLDKTAGEIKAAIVAGQAVWIDITSDGATFAAALASFTSEGTASTFSFSGDSTTYMANTDADYPASDVGK